LIPGRTLGLIPGRTLGLIPGRTLGLIPGRTLGLIPGRVNPDTIKIDICCFWDSISENKNGLTKCLDSVSIWNDISASVLLKLYPTRRVGLYKINIIRK
jgi:hypothetical protein